MHLCQKIKKEEWKTSTPDFPETYENNVESGKIRLFIGREGDKIVSSVQYVDVDDTDEKLKAFIKALFPKDKMIAYLSQMAVHPDKRGKGVDPEQIKHAEDAARVQGFTEIHLRAMVQKNLPKYYEKLGYKKVGKEIVRTTYTLDHMRKVL
jgi:ribosomal protein S18 acetylase RimI-like enzyme